MPKFRIASRGGTTLTNIEAGLKAYYSGTDSKGTLVEQEVINKVTFKNGVFELEEWPLFGAELLNDANSLMLTVQADMPPDQEFYVNTRLQYKLTKVEVKDPKSGKKGFRIEGLPDAVTIALTEVPRTKEQEEKRITEINRTIISSAIDKVKR